MNLFTNKEKYPNAEYLSLNGFYLPSGLGIKNYEIDYISETLNKILKKCQFNITKIRHEYIFKNRND